MAATLDDEKGKRRISNKRRRAQENEEQTEENSEKGSTNAKGRRKKRNKSSLASEDGQSRDVEPAKAAISLGGSAEELADAKRIAGRKLLPRISGMVDRKGPGLGPLTRALLSKQVLPKLKQAESRGSLAEKENVSSVN